MIPQHSSSSKPSSYG